MFLLLVHFHDVLLQNTVIPRHPVPIVVNTILPLAAHVVIYSCQHFYLSLCSFPPLSYNCYFVEFFTCIWEDMSGRQSR